MPLSRPAGRVATVARITLFEAPEDADAFVAAWREQRTGTGARLLASHSPFADFRFAEVGSRHLAAPALPAVAHSARYQAVVDDLPDDAPWVYVLVNPFEVPEADDAEFVRTWTTVRNLVKGRTGYVGSRLHQAIDPGAGFRFVNVAPWRSVDDFTAAVADPAFARAARAIYHRAHPSLFVAVT